MSIININDTIIIIVVYCVLVVLNVTDLIYDHFYYYLAEIKYHLEMIYHTEMIYHIEIKYYLEMIYDYTINYAIVVVYMLVPIYAIFYLRSIATTTRSTESERESNSSSIKPCSNPLVNFLQDIFKSSLSSMASSTGSQGASSNVEDNMINIAGARLKKEEDRFFNKEIKVTGPELDELKKTCYNVSITTPEFKEMYEKINDEARSMPMTQDVKLNIFLGSQLLLKSKHIENNFKFDDKTFDINPDAFKTENKKFLKQILPVLYIKCLYRPWLVSKEAAHTRVNPDQAPEIQKDTLKKNDKFYKDHANIKDFKQIPFKNIKDFNNSDSLEHVLKEVMENSFPSNPTIYDEWSRSFTIALKVGAINDAQKSRMESTAIYYIVTKSEFNQMSIEGVLNYRVNKTSKEVFYGLDLSCSSYAAFIYMCYLVNKGFVVQDEDNAYVLLVFKVPLNFLNNSNFYNKQGQLKLIIKNVGGHQALRLDAEIPISTDMFDSMTALQYNYNMAQFNDEVFKAEEGFLRHYAEFIQIRQSIVPLSLVKEILGMSTHQAIVATSNFYFDQLNLGDKMMVYTRCWEYVKNSNSIAEDALVDKEMPSTLQEFKQTYEILKDMYYKAGVNPTSTEEDFNKLNLDLEMFLFKYSLTGDQDEQKIKIVKAQNEQQVKRIEDLEKEMQVLKEQLKLSSKATSSDMDVDVGVNPAPSKRKAPAA